jgi:hypothetical protein
LGAITLLAILDRGAEFTIDIGMDDNPLTIATINY